MYSPNPEWTPLRNAEKKYKLVKGKKGEAIDLDDIKWKDVIDFSNLDKNTPQNNEHIIKVELKEHDVSEKQINAFTICGFEGFYFIPSSFTMEQQLHWINQSLQVYTLPPNNTNLNPFHGSIPHLFEDALKEYISSPSIIKEGKKKEHDHSITKKKKLPPTTIELLEKLRWTTLGYQYDWTNRTYPKDKHYDFPKDLLKTTKEIAERVGSEIEPQAAIINYYSNDSTLGGHLDDVEEDMDHPIVSMSFGNTGVFLLGGETKDVEPLAMYVRSGDVMIMGGRSRKCYHGVPRIFEGTCPNFKKEKDESETESFVADFVHRTRININIRQVLPNNKVM